MEKKRPPSVNADVSFIKTNNNGGGCGNENADETLSAISSIIHTPNSILKIKTHDLINRISIVTKGGKLITKCPQGNGAILQYSDIKSQKENDRSDMYLYPNPATNNVTITFSTAKQTSYKITVFDMQGKTLLQKQTAATAGANQFNIDISRLAKRTYILGLQNNDEVRIGKIVKK